MNKFLKMMAILLSMSLVVFSCDSDDEEEEDEMIGGSPVGSIEVTGDESFEFGEPVVLTTSQEVTTNGITYTFLTANILDNTSSSNQNSVNVGFLIPTSVGSVPPNGVLPVLGQEAGLNEPYAAITITGMDIYSSTSATTGTLTISNSSSSNGTFDVLMNIQNITSFNDASVDLIGIFTFE